MRGRKLLAAGLPLLVLTIFLVAACSEETVSEPTPIVLSGEDADAMMEESDADVMMEDSDADAAMEDSDADVMMEDSGADAMMEDADADAMMEDKDADTVMEDSDADAMMEDKDADAMMEDSDADAMMEDKDADAMMEDKDADVMMEDKEQDLMVGEKNAMRQCPDCSRTAVLAQDLSGSGSYRFDPDGLTFQVGETVEFTVTSENEFHTFTIDELGIDVSIGPGETETFTFTFQEAGTFKLVCIPHQSLGMTGTITVVNGGDAKTDDEDGGARITMVTDMDQQSIAIEALKAGANDFIIKPFDPGRVLAAVQKMVS